MYYTYIIESLRDGAWYYGSTGDTIERLNYHNRGWNRSTKGRGPWNPKRSWSLIRTSASKRNVRCGYGHTTSKDVVGNVCILINAHLHSGVSKRSHADRKFESLSSCQFLLLPCKSIPPTTSAVPDTDAGLWRIEEEACATRVPEGLQGSPSAFLNKFCLYCHSMFGYSPLRTTGGVEDRTFKVPLRSLPLNFSTMPFILFESSLRDLDLLFSNRSSTFKTLS